MPFDQSAYSAQYKKDHYETFLLRFPKGYKAELQEYAKANDLSLQQLILKALESQYHFDFSQKPKSKK